MKKKKRNPSGSDRLVMIVQLESSDMFSENKAGKECETVTEEGWKGPQIGHKKNPTFFRENSHLGLQNHSDTSREEWCRVGDGRGKEGRMRRKEIRHHLSVYKESNKY